MSLATNAARTLRAGVAMVAAVVTLTLASALGLGTAQASGVSQGSGGLVVSEHSYIPDVASQAHILAATLDPSADAQISCKKCKKAWRGVEKSVKGTVRSTTRLVNHVVNGNVTAPTNLRVTREGRAGNLVRMRLRWDDGRAEKNYKVQRQYLPAGRGATTSVLTIATVASGSTTYLDGGAIPGQLVQYRVCATGQAEKCSDWYGVNTGP